MAKREELSPAYSELPPREIFVEATNSVENVGAEAMQLEDEMIHFPTSPRLEDAKAKVFTFEGLTPVSTVEDAREDLVVDSLLVEKESGVRRDESFIDCSPLTVDQSRGEDMNDNDDMHPDSAQIVSVCSSVKEKVAAWERHVASMRSTDMYDVPFDEDPMPKNISKSEDVEKSVNKAPFIALSNNERIEEEGLMEDTTNMSHMKELVVETLNLQSDSIVPENKPSASEALERSPTLSHPIPAVADLSLLDQEEETEIHAAPSDEMETTPCMDMNVSKTLQPDGAQSSTVQMTGMESYGCPDEFCTQVSKLWT